MSDCIKITLLGQHELTMRKIIKILPGALSVALSVWLCGCMPTDKQLAETANEKTALILTDAKGNTYVATHYTGNQWFLVPVSR